MSVARRLSRIASASPWMRSSPGLVAELVVDRLQPVEVEHDERQRDAGAPDALELARQVLLEGAVVAQAGERVGDGDLREPRELLAAERAGG